MTHRHMVSRNKIIKSKGLLFALIVLYVFLFVGLINYVASRGVYTLPLQLVLYVTVFIIAWLVYRNHMVEYRYEVSEKSLFVFRVVGKREKPMDGLLLSDIESILPYADAIKGVRGLEHNLCAVSKKHAQVVAYHNEKGRLLWLLISPSDAFLRILKDKTAAAKAAVNAFPNDAETGPGGE